MKNGVIQFLFFDVSEHNQGLELPWASRLQPVRVAAWIIIILLRYVQKLHIDYNHEGIV